MSFNPYPEWGRGADEADMTAGLKAFRTPLGEYLGAQVREGFWATLPGQALAQRDRLTAEAPNETPLTAEEWRASPHFRPSIPFDEKFTPARAKAVADIHDENAYRRWLIEQRDAGALDGTLGFVAGIAGSIPDPVNFIPFFGPAFRAARVAKYGVVAGRALVGAGEGALGTAIAQPFLVPSRNQFGDDVGFADITMDIAFGAFAGSAIGGASGVWSKFTAARVEARGRQVADADLAVAPRDTSADPVPDVPRQNAALYTLDRAAQDVAAGRSVDLDPRIVGELAGLRIEQAAEAAARNVENLPLPRAIDFAAAAPEPLPFEQIQRTPGASPYERVPPAPQRLSDFIKAFGGIKDDGGEVSTLMGRTHGMPGLSTSKRGMSLDDATRNAWENGYFPEFVDRPTPDVLLAALSDELSGKPRFRPDDDAGERAAVLKSNDQIDQLANELDIDTRGITRAQFDDLVAERMSAEEAYAANMALADDIAAAYTRLQAEAEAFLALRGEVWAPEWRPEGRPRTLADLEAEDVQLRMAQGDRGRRQNAGNAQSVGKPAGTVSGDSGQGRPGVDAERRSNSQAASPERRDVISDTTGLLDDLDALVATGRLSAEDAAMLKEARQALADTAAFDDGAAAAASCFRR